MKAAFKEWAIVVDALARGDQIIILRKGGIREGRGGFQMTHDRFWLFPTRYHQQRGSVIPGAQARFDALPSSWPPDDRLELQFFAEVVTWHRLDSLAMAEQLEGQHIWRPEIIANRFEWGREANIHALAVRVWQLPKRIHLPMAPQYGGCLSWIELEEELATDAATPVLTDESFQKKLRHFQEALQIAPSPN